MGQESVMLVVSEPTKFGDIPPIIIIINLNWTWDIPSSGGRPLKLLYI